MKKMKKPIRITRFGKPVAEVVSVSPKVESDWMGSMKDRFEILGDIISPANEEGDWEVLRD
jgi:antitoxin (DNA-binding transcriptional repressor) of toxin-antitoxin stability system